MVDTYHVTDGRNEKSFDYTPEGLREAWEYARSLPHLGDISNPNRVDLDCDGLTDEDRDRLDEFDNEAYPAEHADEIAFDAYWQDRIDEARGK